MPAANADQRAPYAAKLNAAGFETVDVTPIGEHVFPGWHRALGEDAELFARLPPAAGCLIGCCSISMPALCTTLSITCWRPRANHEERERAMALHDFTAKLTRGEDQSLASVAEGNLPKPPDFEPENSCADLLMERAVKSFFSENGFGVIVL